MGFRRMIAVGAALVLLCHLTGCAGLGKLFSTNPFDSNKYKDEFVGRPGYARLDAAGQELYGTLYTAVTDTFDTDSTVMMNGTQSTYGIQVTLPTPIPIADAAYLEKITACFQYDNPQFFHVSTTRYATNTATIDGEKQYVSLALLFTLAPQERVAAKQELDAVVEDILAHRPETDDPYLTELYLHDRLTAICTYDNEAATADQHSNPHARSAYGALVEGTAICGGYTQAMTLLLERCGIPATYVMNKAGDHVWNMVEIGGQFYHLDATWNDSNDQGYHLYFNCPTEELSPTHDIATENNDLPVCHATTDNYYRRTGIYAKVRDSEVLAKQIAAAILQGQDVIEILARPEAYEYCLLFLKQNSRVMTAVNAELVSSGTAMWEYDLYSMADEHKLFLHKINA